MAILEIICLKILEMSIVASIIGVITLGVQKLFRKKIPPHYLKWIWIVFLMMLVNPIRMESKFSIYNLSQFSIQEIRGEEKEQEERILLTSQLAFGHNGSITNEKESEISKKLEESEMLENSENLEENALFEIEEVFDMHPLQNPISFLAIKQKELAKLGVIVYGIGLLITFIWKCFLNLKIITMPQEEFENERLKKILEKAKQKLQIKQSILLMKQNQIRTPAIYGGLKKKIFLQEDILNLTDAEIEIIFLHELAHLKNGDLSMNVLLQGLQIIYWFQPVIHFLLKKIKKDMELSNDAFVIKVLEVEKEKVKLYLKTLVKVSTSFEMQNGNVLAMASDSKELEERIRMIKEKNKFMKSPVALLGIMTVLILGITVCFATNQISEEYEEKQETLLKNPEMGQEELPNAQEEKQEILLENQEKNPEMLAIMEEEKNVVKQEESQKEIEITDNYEMQDEKEEEIKLEVGRKPSNIVNPLEGEKVISATYSENINPFTEEKIAHNGIDFVAFSNEKVMAIADGIVETTGYESKLGNQIRIKHEIDGEIYYSIYGCLSEIEVEPGDVVEAGDEIGKVGSTGMSTGPHLHLELTDEVGNSFHPAEWLDI